MLRYANFWRSLFDVKKLQPFTQFIKPKEFQEHKNKVTLRVKELILGTDMQSRGQLERCFSKVTELTINSGSTPGGRNSVKLTKEMLD